MAEEEPRQPTFEELRARVAAQPAGKQRYAGTAGRGPIGETCRSCGHVRASGNVRMYPKCGLVKWTHGDATTIKVRTPACEYWSKPYAITRENWRNPPRQGPEHG